MSDTDGEGRSRSRSRSRTQSPHQDDAKVRLARIFISNNGTNEYEWDGRNPQPGDTLFVYYVEVNDQTYRNYIKNGDDKRTFDHFRSKNNNVTISYLYSPDIIREPPPLHYHRSDSSFVSREKRNQATLLLSLMKGRRIFQNNHDFSCWYKLESSDVYSDEYNRFKETYDFLDVKVYDDLDLNEYMYISQFVPGKIDLKLLKREIGGNHPCFRCIFKIKKPQGGGKTRRKCKVKKRRNRRRINTMKRRKTTANRRYR
jgi:hypothetical protein